MEIHIIRHTKVAVPDSICFGQTDVALREEWKKDLAEVQIDADYDVVYSSPLSRCTQLADFFKFEYQIDTRLKEMNFGAWEMQAWDAIPLEQIQPWYDNFIHINPPEGENLVILKERINDFWEEIQEKHKDQKVLVITHSGVIRILLQLVIEFPLENLFIVQPQHGKKMVLTHQYGIWKWLGLNV